MPDFGGFHSWTSKLRAFLKTPSSSTTKHSSIRAQKKRTSIPFHPVNPNLMDTSLHHVWESASGNPFLPTVGKDSHFVVGFSLLTIGLLLSGLPICGQHPINWDSSFVIHCIRCGVYDLRGWRLCLRYHSILNPIRNPKAHLLYISWGNIKIRTLSILQTQTL
ncbi:hypothetical protein HYFRA_00010928 [Hymenoscyphus fraxineus]|uniref:Uncharacterized protein n=1 Tax=Hymenoscyphus fraxineus TaxID=746836 RepID=A0A9N9KXG5_9HELO|nr:hypothetical protein HYFRA_00010928 [Hymenoscyphus fraxineus]